MLRSSSTRFVSRFALLALLGLFLGAPAFALDEPVELDGKIAASALFALDVDSGESGDAQGTLNASLSKVFMDGHVEAGGSFISSFSKDFGAYFLGATSRYNLAPMGPEENIVLYAGVNFGVSIFTFSFGGIDETEATVSGGPKFGVEYYFSPRVAVQLEDAITFYEEQNPLGGSDTVVQNTLSLGFRLLFEGIGL